ncbi:reverse transcriptase domain-containing protein [Tanacetum coccineum]|uniref:Reverse transcriptase domain-containing protein n=1 Tax=Tanacetum coccineum TaxID=301880 RepID=A0ABQ5G2X8_9ASTR
MITTMGQLLEAPTEGYEDAIVVPEINANFELKHGLINLVQNKQFFGHDKEDPHAHIRYFNKITSTMKFPNVPSTSRRKLTRESFPSRGGIGSDKLVESMANRSISEPIGIAEDVYVTVGKFQFPADFVVVDFEPDPRVPLILGRSFLKTSRALIDVYEGEITLRVGKEAITFNLDQTSRYTADYNHMTANRIDIIDMACEEYSQEVLGFSDVIASGNPTSLHDPIVSTSSPTLTSNRKLLLEQSKKILKICEANRENSSVNEPPELELKDLPPHLEYAFLEGDDKLPVIIAKDLKDEEKAALIEVLKSHKRAIAWNFRYQGYQPRVLYPQNSHGRGLRTDGSASKKGKSKNP